VRSKKNRNKVSGLGEEHIQRDKQCRTAPIFFLITYSLSESGQCRPGPSSWQVPLLQTLRQV
jgi:hypothetical protein